ncbi:hypothetical protein F4821DRAFT_235138 [Hypoxylon rubiginosum]|uniref:Uncharacterized protein n=1 Tax=Hypoxylon rubiginosum TaxID=110542 RepID=A0ACC0D5Q6_9PEZI|nr:hypothetical protein F4821DRAFT_235138 [Hypoxylon rubiginosum]
MSSSDLSPREPHPSYEILRAERPVFLSPAAKHIFWTLNGSLSTQVFILSEAFNVDSQQTPFLQETSEGAVWHASSSAPFTEPSVSSITVTVDELDRWEDEWLEYNRGVVPGVEGAVFGPLPNYDPEKDEEEEEGGRGHLLEAFGIVRPRRKEEVIHIKPAEGSEFVTIRDYVTAVHPRLMARRADILGALGTCNGDDDPKPDDTRLVVQYSWISSVNMEIEAEYLARARRPWPNHLGPPKLENDLSVRYPPVYVPQSDPVAVGQVDSRYAPGGTAVPSVRLPAPYPGLNYGRLEDFENGRWVEIGYARDRARLRDWDLSSPAGQGRDRE